MDGLNCLAPDAPLLGSQDTDDDPFSQEYDVEVSGSETPSESDSSGLDCYPVPLEGEDSEVDNLSSELGDLEPNSLSSQAIITAQEDNASRLFNTHEDSDLDSIPNLDETSIVDRVDGRHHSDLNLPRTTAEGLPGWRYSSPFANLTVDVDDIDFMLQDRFLVEANTVLENALETCGFERSSSKIMSPMTVIQTFLPRHLLEQISAQCNLVLSASEKPAVTPEELLGVFILHMLCASYGESPNTVCSRKEIDFFFQMGISSRRFYEVWSSLSGTRYHRQQVEHLRDGLWATAPRSANSLILSLERGIADVNRHLVYVPGSTVFSLDDDHLRLSSRAVSDMTGLRVTNNPAKALGPVQNSICSALTGLFIAGHHTRRGESLLDVWKCLVCAIQGASSPSALCPMTDAFFAADRGYNCLSVTEFMGSIGATFIGTYKRSYDYPFVFGDGAISRKHRGVRIAETGSRAVYSACKARKGTSEVIEAIAYRESTNGRVAAAIHNNIHLFGSEKFTLVPQYRFRGMKPFSFQRTRVSGMENSENRSQRLLEELKGQKHVLYERFPDAESASSSHSAASDINSVACPPKLKVLKLLSEVQQLTILQSEDPGWFLLRAFRFTSRTSAAFVRTVGKKLDTVIPVLTEMMTESPQSSDTIQSRDSTMFVQHLRLLFACFGICTNTEDENRHLTVPTLETLSALDEDSVKALRISELKEILAALGERPSGNKAALQENIMKAKERLLSGNHSVPATPARDIQEIPERASSSLVTALLKVSVESWTMKPLICTSGMKEGSKNEKTVLRNLASFIDTHGGTGFPMNVRLDYLQSVGLLCCKQNTMLADSPDALAGLVNNIGDSMCAVVEVKTMTSVATITEAKTIQQRHGKIFSIELSFEESEEAVESWRSFREAVKTTDYRLQCVHHSAVVGSPKVLYVAAKGGRAAYGEIIYVAIITFHCTITGTYLSLLDALKRMAFEWVGKPAYAIPKEYETSIHGSHVPDFHSFSSYYRLSQAMSSAVKYGPLPPARMIRPTILVAWNALKGGVDEYSRIMKHFCRANAAEPPTVTVLGRIIMTQAANSAILYRLSLARARGKLPKIASNPRENELGGYCNLRKQVSKVCTVREFIRRLAGEWKLKNNKSKVNMETAVLDAEHDSVNQEMPRFKRKAVEMFNRGNAKRIRLDASRPHRRISGKRRYCDLCSWTSNISGKLRRGGNKTKLWCETCGQSLCQACFVTWHRDHHLKSGNELRSRSAPRGGRRMSAANNENNT
jgi:B-box zinc finger